jgi:HD-GYP domain-containing protein (c-di-GMP phosphodiesterase class II)
VRYHHEHYDGSGYPAGLKGENIPLDARIIAVADAYDAMTSLRPYRHGRATREQALEELQRYAGRQFDPIVVKAFIRLEFKSSTNVNELEEDALARLLSP